VRKAANGHCRPIKDEPGKGCAVKQGQSGRPVQGETCCEHKNLSGRGRKKGSLLRMSKKGLRGEVLYKSVSDFGKRTVNTSEKGPEGKRKGVEQDAK